MTRFPLITLAILFCCAPTFAQVTYSFDNFDTRNGVRVQVKPPPVQAKVTRARRPTRTTLLQNPGTEPSLSPVVLDSSRSLISPTALTYESPASMSNSGTDLRGYTTGSAEVDIYLVTSGRRFGIDPLLLYSVMHQESSFKSRAISPKGARGLMQLMPMTAARFGVTNIFDPRQNIEGGARYLRFLLDRFNGDLSLTLAGYNAGEGAVEKYGWRIPPYAETQEYVRRISRRYGLLRDPNSALYAPLLNSGQIARLKEKQSVPLNVYERTVLTVRLPDGRLQLMTQ
ncbi:MAG TPA: lytic transglycosylase domain-containing protein [Pyrinomonadaceae bacterium]|nr:lytic transglycosylase domain-containing protein [Pyrinomonadaceae bacterium]